MPKTSYENIKKDINLNLKIYSKESKGLYLGSEES
jgi:hypothetical protein